MFFIFVHTKGAIYNTLTSWIKMNISVLSLLVKKETPIVYMCVALFEKGKE